jgi:hypothetical protein
VIVVTRVRPLNRKEIEMGTQVCLDFHPNKKDIALKVQFSLSYAHDRKVPEVFKSSPSIAYLTRNRTRKRSMTSLLALS